MRWALSTAATQAAGFRVMFGGMGRIIHSGRAAQNGFAAAMMSKAGLESSERAIEAPDGFANVISPRQDWAAITEGLGTVWETAANTYKPYATGIVTQAAIDGCIRLRGAHGLKAADIATMELAVNPIALMLTDVPHPQSANAARLSLQHVTAAAILHGKVGAPEMTDEAVADRDTVALRARVVVAPDEALARDQARVRIALSSGQIHDCFVEHAYGSEQNPMSDADLDAKIRDLCTPVLGAGTAESLISACRGIGGRYSVATIADIARPSSGGGA